MSLIFKGSVAAVAGGVLLATGSYFVATSMSHAPFTLQSNQDFSPNGYVDYSVGAENDYKIFISDPYSQQSKKYLERTYRKWKEKADLQDQMRSLGANASLGMGHDLSFEEQNSDGRTAIPEICTDKYLKDVSELEAEDATVRRLVNALKLRCPSQENSPGVSWLTHRPKTPMEDESWWRIKAKQFFADNGG